MKVSNEANLLEAATLVQEGCPAFFKFLTANDTGKTGAHQCGLYVPTEFAEMVFNGSCVKGENKNLTIQITWNNGKKTESSFKWYGKKKNPESRITQFGRGFEYLRPEYTGALVLFAKEDDRYRAFVFNSDEEMNEFWDASGLSPADAKKMIGLGPKKLEEQAFADFIKNLQVDFPSTEEMSAAARQIENKVYDHVEYVKTKPDEKLINWLETESRLWSAIESNRYGGRIKNGFDSIEDFSKMAKSFLNSRKSRAGKSLEHHLSAIFDANGLEFQGQVRTEGNKKPDFIFPSSEAYHNSAYPEKKLVFLAAKTTCKDRWRQILNEANRFRKRTKFLCTLQQGMTENQMNEMANENVVLVVPEAYEATYSKNTNLKILTMAQFISTVQKIQREPA